MWNFVDVVVFKITMFANLNKLKTMETNTNAIKEGSSLYLHPRGFFVLNIMDLAKYLSKMVRIVKLYSLIKLELVNILNTYIVQRRSHLMLVIVLPYYKQFYCNEHAITPLTQLYWWLYCKVYSFCILRYPSLLILALGVQQKTYQNMHRVTLIIFDNVRTANEEWS